jgi:RNA polymerase sigma-70 factor (ECF subfamily)
VLYWCGRWGLAGEGARDVAQEIFAAVAGGIDGFRRDRPDDIFRGWRRGITRHKVLMALRREGRRLLGSGCTEAVIRLRAVPDLPEVDYDPPEELHRLYHRAVGLVRAEFEGRSWEMFWRVTVDGREVAAVATEFGVTPTAVRQARSRVLRRLKEELGELPA